MSMTRESQYLTENQAKNRFQRPFLITWYRGTVFYRCTHQGVLFSIFEGGVLFTLGQILFQKIQI